uniref:Neuro_bHLH domain-containing protein n=1 Tax=Macrostomum lignano TaxID=282301 RepID=A0A1I8IYQ9_9PLAT
ASRMTTATASSMKCEQSAEAGSSGTAADPSAAQTASGKVPKKRGPKKKQMTPERVAKLKLRRSNARPKRGARQPAPVHPLLLAVSKAEQDRDSETVQELHRGTQRHSEAGEQPDPLAFARALTDGLSQGTANLVAGSLQVNRGCCWPRRIGEGSAEPPHPPSLPLPTPRRRSATSAAAAPGQSLFGHQHEGRNIGYDFYSDGFAGGYLQQQQQQQQQQQMCSCSSGSHSTSSVREVTVDWRSLADAAANQLLGLLSTDGEGSSSRQARPGAGSADDEQVKVTFLRRFQTHMPTLTISIENGTEQRLEPAPVAQSLNLVATEDRAAPTDSDLPACSRS